MSGATANAAPSLSELERQIDEAWNKLEPVIEQHNATRAQLNTNRAKVDQLTKQIQPLQLQVDLALSKVSAIAAHRYMGGDASALNALLTSGSPTAFADQLEMLDQVARGQKMALSGVTDLKSKYEAQKKPIDDLVAQLTATEATLATQAKQIDAEIKRLNTLRLQAYGTTTQTGSLRPALCPQTYPGGKAGIAVKFACQQIGKPYVWAADGPGSYDCSGLALAAWRQAGVYLPHNAYQQYRMVPAISRANLRPGDLVFYYSDVHHMGMYVGGNWIVHAPHAGDVVRMQKLDHAPIKGFGRPSS